MAIELLERISKVAHENIRRLMNRYMLSLCEQISSLLVRLQQSCEQQNPPLRYAIAFIRHNKHCPIDSVVSLPASLTFLVPNIIQQVSQTRSLAQLVVNHIFYSAVTESSQLLVNHYDDARYKTELKPCYSLIGGLSF